jgi:hypothetical protein
MWFQHDGVQDYFTNVAPEYLNKMLATNALGVEDQQPSPARSRDLTPLDFFL